MKTKILCCILFTAVVLCISACHKEKDNCKENIGPINCAEFNTVQPPTYQQVITCYESAILTNPQLTDSALTRSIFDCIKAAPVQNPTAKPLFDLQSRMCQEEWKLVLLFPRKAYSAFKNGITQSLERAKLEFSQDIDIEFKNAKADAFRNAYYGVLVSKNTDTAFARRLAIAHQSCLPNLIGLYNDTAGIGLVRRYPTASPTQLIDLLLERRYYFLVGDIPANLENTLLFSAGRRNYDASFAGTTTNPDGPGNWTATFYFNQNGNTIRGEARYAGIGFPAKDHRRFKGSINGNTISLTMSDPYSFEITPGYVPCYNMTENFTITQDSLTGRWSASNCGRGGDTKLKKQ